MIHAIQAFSVRPKKNYDNLSMSKVYPVLWITEGEDYDSYVVRDDNGIAAYIQSIDATIEAEVPNENTDNR